VGIEVYLDYWYIEEGLEPSPDWQPLNYNLNVKEVETLRDFLTEYLK
jgi:hypothetical protein